MPLLDMEEENDSHFFLSQPLDFGGNMKSDLQVLKNSSQSELLVEHEQAPLITLASVEYRPPAPIVTMVVMNEVVIMALKNNHVIRIDLRNPNKVEDIELSIKSSDTVHRLFLDESGQHLLIALVSADTLYLHSSAHKTKPVTKLKGHLVEAVAFDKHYTDAQSSGSGNLSTKTHSGVQALIATSKGHIYESEIETVEARFFQGNSVDKYMRLVHMVPNEECITGLMLSAFADESQPALITPKSSSGSHSGAEDVKYLLVVTTANRMYEFIGYKRTDAPIWKRLFMEEDGGLLKGLGTSLAHGSRGTGSISRGPHTIEAKDLVKSLQTDQPTTVSSPKQTEDGVKSPTKTRMPPSLDRLIVESASASSLTEASRSSSPKRGSTSTTPSSSRQNANKHNVSSLLVHYKYSGVPTSLAWVSARSVYLSNVVFGTHSMGESVCGSDAAVIALDHKREPAVGQALERRNTSASPRTTRTIPSSFALTEFHVIRLGSDNRVTVYCVLDQEVVYTTTYAQSEYGRLTGLTRDVEKDTIWVFGPDGIHELLFNDETRSVWKIYLARNQFATALEYSRDKPEITDYIHSQQGNYYFDQCKYILAAQSYAKSSHVALEEIALKLMDIDQYEALQEYISRRLDNLKPDQKAQATMLTMWLIELYLSQLDRCVDRGDDDTQLQSQLRQFLTKPVVKQNLSANHTAVYNLICSHGRIEDGVFYANHMGDYERVVSHHIACHDYEAALEVLALQSNLSLYYNFSSQLLMNAPQLAVDSWLKQPKLDPRRLVPAVAIYTKKYPNISIQENQALRYLEKVITELGVQDPAIQNCLISVYVSYNADEKLIDFLQKSSGYDRQYVLRLCFESNKLHACVEIYKQMGLYEEAVTLALKVDVELAKDITELPDEDDESLRKRLWLKIAHHVIEEDHNIERAMKLLEEQSDLVKIEDILPFFPEFVKIDHFKDSITKSLLAYNKHIEHLQEQMNEATKSAALIRKDLKDSRNKYGVVMGDDRCCSCDQIALIRQFYLFPCGHVFHVDCLYNEVAPHIVPAVQTRIAQLKQLIEEESMPDHKDQQKEDVVIVVPQIDKYKNELDDIIAGECVLCGSLMIRSLDEPFIDDEELNDVLASWAI